MPETTSYPPGTPSWVDLASPDPDAAKTFYAGLFGWTIETSPDPAAGGYSMCLLDGKPVAGLGPLMSDQQPPAWNTYVTVADADATSASANETGGMVFAEPFDVLDAGRMAVLADPTGAVISIWQPGVHPGAAVVGEPGTFCWNELNTRDPDAARPFYETVFGWAPHPIPDVAYTEWRLGETPVGGMLDMRGRVPDEVPAHWLVYFAVADTDATVAEATTLGGSVAVPPVDIPPGRFAVVRDPQGAHFGVIRLAATR